MNNSKIAFDNVEEIEVSEPKDRLTILEKQKGEWTQIVEAINRVEANEDWQKLKRLVFDGVLADLERRVLNEVAQDEVDTPELYRLQGQLAWAKKYADLKKLGNFFRQQIEHIKNQLNND